MSAQHYHIEVQEEDGSLRLDKFLSLRLADLSRSRLQALIDEGCVTCDGAPVGSASRKIKPGQRYEIHIPDIAPSHILPQDMPLDIIFEDAHLLIINKPPGLTVHPAPGHPDRTLVNALLAHCGASLSGIGGVARPGIVHRIDKDTSGLLVVAKHDKAHAHLSAQLSERTLKRTYNALVWGAPPTSGTITGNIGRSPKNRQKMAVLKTGGKEATTHFKTLEPFASGVTLLECNLETGRTHQIRVHLTHIGHPLVGDPVYGPTTHSQLGKRAYAALPAPIKTALLAFKRQALHAKALGLIHPESGKEMRFECPLPEDMAGLIEALS